ncbi:MAG: tetratricopeptide repeat protein [Polyangiales bacterium]
MRLVALLVALTLGLATPAMAQPRTWEGPDGEPSESTLGEARALFVRGTELAAEGRWADALEAFERAYTLSGVLAALFNVATTLRSLGRYVDARDAFDQVLRATPDDELRDEATRLRAGSRGAGRVGDRRRVPRDPQLTFWVDGARAPLDDTRPVTRDIDPGPHTLRLELEGHTPWLWEGHADDGARLTLEAELVPLPPTRRRRPGLWVTVALVVAGALATGAYFLFFHDRGLSPGSDQVIRL